MKTRLFHRNKPALGGYMSIQREFKAPARYMHNNPALGGYGSKKKSIYKVFHTIMSVYVSDLVATHDIYTVWKRDVFLPHISSSAC
jgi:hypothetical protein